MPDMVVVCDCAIVRLCDCNGRRVRARVALRHDQAMNRTSTPKEETYLATLALARAAATSDE